MTKMVKKPRNFDKDYKADGAKMSFTKHFGKKGIIEVVIDGKQQQLDIEKCFNDWNYRKKQDFIAWYDKYMINKAKDDFWHFCMYMNRPFFSKRKILKQVADAFQQIYNGEIKHLGVSLPPRTGKSLITSYFNTWFLGKKPEESIMRLSCGSDLFRKFSYDVRSFLDSERFRNVFPDVRLSRDRKAIDRWNTNLAKQISFFGGGVGTNIIGFGASGLAVTDDLYTGITDALNPTRNEFIKDWLLGTFDSRLESGCPTIDIGTRWSYDDILGMQEQLGYYDLQIIIPALDANDESFCDDVKTTEEYHELRSKMRDLARDHIWDAEYMQQPVAEKGLMFPAKQLNWFHVEELNGKEPDTIMQYSDPADRGADYYASVIGYVYKTDVYIVDVMFSQRDMTECVIRSCEQAKKHKVRTIVAEINMGGSLLEEKIVNEMDGYPCVVECIKNTKNKIERINYASSFIRKRFHFRNDDGISGEYKQFMMQVTNYKKNGKNIHDDAPESCVGLQEHIFNQTASIEIW